MLASFSIALTALCQFEEKLETRKFWSLMAVLALSGLCLTIQSALLIPVWQTPSAYLDFEYLAKFPRSEKYPEAPIILRQFVPRFLPHILTFLGTLFLAFAFHRIWLRLKWNE
jgi:hypothetical protein